MNDLPSVVTQYDEDAHDAKRGGRYGEEVAGRDIGQVIIEERASGLRGWFPIADHVLGHSLLRHMVAQQGKFGYDPRSAPGQVLPGHAANQLSDFAFEQRTSTSPSSRFPAPIQPESLAMPADDGFRLDNDEC